MKKLAVVLMLMSCCSAASALEPVVNLVYHYAFSENAEPASYGSGGVWLRHEFDNDILFDLDLEFERDRGKVNVAQIKFMSLPSTDLVIGRQQVGWGVGYAVNPVDVINPRPIGATFDPTFVRDGRDAVAVKHYFDNLSNVELIYAAELIETKDYEGTPLDLYFKSDAGIKAKTNFHNFDVSASYIDRGERTFDEVVQPADRVWGLEIAGTVPVIDWGIWNESAYYSDAQKLEMVLGADYYWGDYHFTCEYYYNQFGSTERTEYDFSQLMTGRFLAQDYLIASLMWAYNEKLAFTGFGFWNMNDAGLIGGGVVDYSFNDNLEFIFMPYVLKGGSDTEVGLQKSVFGRYGAEAMIKWVF